jgi:hypothetical protein
VHVALFSLSTTHDVDDSPLRPGLTLASPQSRLLLCRCRFKPARGRRRSPFSALAVMALATLSNLSDDTLRLVFEEILEAGSSVNVYPLISVCKRFKVRSVSRGAGT